MPDFVFANAFALPIAPVKGVVIVNKKYLSHELGRGRSSAAAADLWERREDVKHLLTQNLVKP